MEVPSIRASFLHANFEALAALGPASARKVRERLPPGVLRDAEESTRVAWLPVGHDVLLTEAVDVVLGRHVMHDWTRDGLVRSINSPLLSPLVRSARAIFGLSPHGFLKRVPHGFGALYRNCGAMTYEAADARAASIGWSGSPAVVAQSDAYVSAMSAALEAILIVAGERTGVVHASGVRPDLGMSFRCAW